MWCCPLNLLTGNTPTRFSIDEFTDETVAKMEIPVMEFSYGEKVHRSDVTYALFNQTPLMQDMGKNQNYDAEKKR